MCNKNYKIALTKIMKNKIQNVGGEVYRIPVANEDIFGIDYFPTTKDFEYRLGNWTWTGWCKTTDNIMVFLHIMGGCNHKPYIKDCINVLNDTFILNNDTKEYMVDCLDSEDFWYWFAGGNKLNFELYDTQYDLIYNIIEDEINNLEEDDIRYELLTDNKDRVIDNVLANTLTLDDIEKSVREAYEEVIKEEIMLCDSFKEIIDMLDRYRKTIEEEVYEMVYEDVGLSYSYYGF